ncbi:MAG TPA: PKD domain-containing protein [Candidatus Eisenbacteria bacterium]|nr:PKD domain-containing protein [Candidatus Eisenbacteria bacterium]
MSRPSHRVRTGPLLAAASLLLLQPYTAAAQINELPRIDPIADVTVAPGAILDVPVHAADPDGDPIAFTLNFPPAFVTASSVGPNDGVIRLAPQAEDAGSAVLTVVAQDPSDAVDWATFLATITPPSGYPIAYAGGPYLEGTELDGTRSFDPEGSALTYFWEFGDGSTATGPTPVWDGYQSSTSVTLIVTDDAGHSSKGTSYIVGRSYPVRVLATPVRHPAFLKLPGGQRTFCVQLETDPPRFPFDLRYIDLATVTLSLYFDRPLEEVPAIAEKTEFLGDTNHDGYPEVLACFRTEDISRSFEPHAPGGYRVHFEVHGRSRIVGEFVGGFDFEVRKTGPALAARVTPQPTRASGGTIEFVTAQQGPARLELFDVRGRLVDVLIDGRNLSAGSHSLPLAGRGGANSGLVPGVYFYRLRAGGESATGKVVVTR